MNERAKEKFQVLIADDSEGDRFILRTAMRRAARMEIAAEVSNGEEVINYLSQCLEAPGPARPEPPHLLLLDLKMPVLDGFDVLEWLRPQKLGAMSVVVLTNSMQPDHIARALNLGADFFQVKPRNQKECISMVLTLEERLINGLSIALPSFSSRTLSRYHQMT